ncbi:hypothetical protein DFH06DRAFT_1126585 [Mycena polygramma]|nr:hypothetical protein DFH06DRAFT_1126585 [Mycena polygramma]
MQTNVAEKLTVAGRLVHDMNCKLENNTRESDTDTDAIHDFVAAAAAGDKKKKSGMMSASKEPGHLGFQLMDEAQRKLYATAESEEQVIQAMLAEQGTVSRDYSSRTTGNLRRGVKGGHILSHRLPHRHLALAYLRPASEAVDRNPRTVKGGIDRCQIFVPASELGKQSEVFFRRGVHARWTPRTVRRVGANMRSTGMGGKIHTHTSPRIEHRFFLLKLHAALKACTYTAVQSASTATSDRRGRATILKPPDLETRGHAAAATSASTQCSTEHAHPFATTPRKSCGDQQGREGCGSAWVERRQTRAHRRGVRQRRPRARHRRAHKAWQRRGTRQHMRQRGYGGRGRAKDGGIGLETMWKGQLGWRPPKRELSNIRRDKGPT